MKNIIDIIQKYSLTVRCLPHVVVSHYGYREGDEERIKKPIYNANGKPITNIKRTIVDGYGTWPKDRKFIKEERTVKYGGWWHVIETKHTDSTIRFSTKHDFFAPTLEEAIQLFLESKKSNKL